MPTYEYECRSCGADFDVFQSMSDAPLTVCPSCGQSVRRKINGGTGIIFKGSGFYVNDNRKSSSDSKSRSSGEKADRDGRASEKSAREGTSPKSDAGTAAVPASTAATSSASSTGSKAEAGPKKDAT